MCTRIFKFSITLLLFAISNVVSAQCAPSYLNLTYNFVVLSTGQTVTVTWDADCPSSLMNMSLVSLPPLPYQVQQVDNLIVNSGSNDFTIELELIPGQYLFYIENVGQDIWDYGDTFLIEDPVTCDYPTILDLTYSFDVLETGQTVEVTWDSNCEEELMNISLGSLPPLPFQVQQVDNVILNSGSRFFTLDDDLLPGEYLFYIENVDQDIWDYGDTFVITSAVLPVVFESFELSIEGDFIELTWEVSQVANVREYVIEAYTGAEWKSLAFAANTSLNRLVRRLMYSPTYEAYRIKVVDWDEAIMYSTMRYVNLSTEGSGFFYNRLNQQVQFMGNTTPFDYQLYNMSGQLVNSGKSHSGAVKMYDLKKGVYFFHAKGERPFRFVVY